MSRPKAAHIFSQLEKYINQKVKPAIVNIAEERKSDLNKLAKNINEKISKKEPAKLIFICTHNSRRSQMIQIWAQTAAYYFNIKEVYTFSGGMESTAFDPRAVAAMKRAGFAIEDSRGENPHYLVKYSGHEYPIESFSKKYNDTENPQKGFYAVMTCSQADAACPIVPGAEERFSISYEDPKEADNTLEETKKYDERCLQIASEIFYLFSKVNQLKINI